MSIADKLTQVAENQQAVYNAGYAAGAENGGGTKDHSILRNRDLPDAHPMSAITGLEETFTNAEESLDIVLEIQNELIESGGCVHIPRIETTESVVTIEPNKFYVFPQMASLEIVLGGAVNTTIVQEYKFRFESGDVATILILPENVKGDIKIDANTINEISIVDGYAICQSWAVSA